MDVHKALLNADADLYEQAKDSLVHLGSTPEKYLRMCYERAVKNEEQFIERYQNGESLEKLISEIGDQVIDELIAGRKNEHPSV